MAAAPVVTVSSISYFTLTTSPNPLSDNGTNYGTTKFSIILRAFDFSNKEITALNGETYKVTYLLGNPNLNGWTTATWPYVVSSGPLPQVISATLATSASGAVINGIAPITNPGTLAPGSGTYTLQASVDVTANGKTSTLKSNTISNFLVVGANAPATPVVTTPPSITTTPSTPITYPAPTIGITSDSGLTPTTAITAGSNINLSFNINNGGDPTTSCSASGGWGPGPVGSTSGSFTQLIQNVTTTSTYTLTCTNSGGTDSKSVTVYVANALDLSPMSFHLTSLKSSIVPPGPNAQCGSVFGPFSTSLVSVNMPSSAGAVIHLPAGETYMTTFYLDTPDKTLLTVSGKGSTAQDILKTQTLWTTLSTTQDPANPGSVLTTTINANIPKNVSSKYNELGSTITASGSSHTIGANMVIYQNGSPITTLSVPSSGLINVTKAFPTTCRVPAAPVTPTAPGATADDIYCANNPSMYSSPDGNACVANQQAWCNVNNQSQTPPPGVTICTGALGIDTESQGN